MSESRFNEDKKPPRKEAKKLRGTSPQASIGPGGPTPARPGIVTNEIQHREIESRGGAA